MYKEYFGLKEEPFSIAPDPQFLYMSERHREALAHLIYGMKVDSGFVLLTGEVGTGKTTICRSLLNQIPDDSEIAFILNPKLSVLELLATICDELGIAYPPEHTSVKIFVDRLNLFLLDAHSRGRKTVLIIDEAQNLSTDVLEQIRLLTNLETNKKKLLQVIMLGQPELNRLLERPELRQLSQRVTARYHLEPLSKDELEAYLNYRLTVAGVERPLFPRATVSKLYRLSGGVPRLINLICDRALLGAYARGENLVSPRLLAQAAAEIFGQKQETPAYRKLLVPGLVGGLLMVIALFGLSFLVLTPQPQADDNAVVAEVPDEMEQAPLVEPDEADAVPVAATVEPAEEPPPQLTPLSWIGSEAKARSRNMAFTVLLALWGHGVDSGNPESFSDFDRYGLRLLEERGSLARLRQLNHPAVLRLTDSDGDIFHVVLTGLDDETATLVIGEDVVRVSLTLLLKQWFGDYALLWQTPPGYRGILRAGHEGLAVLWLEQQLAQLLEREERLEPGLQFNEAMADDVRTFQRSEGLDADGLVGPYTLIMINSRLSKDQPRLISSSR